MRRTNAGIDTKVAAISTIAGPLHGRRGSLWRLLSLWGLSLSLSIGVSGARAQSPNWPQRPVKWILSQPAGAGPDIVARFLAEQLSKHWGQ